MRFHVEGADFASVLFHDSIADAEPQPRPFADALGSQEGIEYALRIAEPQSAIGDSNADDAVIQPRPNCDAFFIRRIHRVKSVVQQVEEDLFKLCLVKTNGGQIA